MNFSSFRESFIIKYFFTAFTIFLLISCSKGIEEDKRAAETAKDEAVKSGADKLLPRMYEVAVKNMKSAGRKAENNDMKKARALYTSARKKFLEAGRRAPEKKAKIEKSIQTALVGIETAKKTAEGNIGTISKNCAEEIAARILGRTSSAKELVFKYFDNLKEKAENKMETANKLVEKAKLMEGDAKLSEKNNKLKKALSIYNISSKIAVEICTKTETNAKKIASNNGTPLEKTNEKKNSQKKKLNLNNLQK